MRSMTAFARSERQGEWGSLTLELRSVNHRYLEPAIRLPEELRPLEPKVRERLAAALGRGKVDCNLRLQPPAEQGAALELDEALAARLAHLSRELDGLIYNAAPISSLELMRWPGVLRAPAPDTERLAQEALAALEAALGELVATRGREGEKLAALVEQRCGSILEIVAAVRERLPAVVEHQRTRLAERVAELQAELDPQRLEQEVALLAQKADVAEELDRLEAHVAEVRQVLGRSEPVGRRLDFLMQELNREANTLASKSIDTETTRAAVDLKVLIEQMREQVQNIE